MKLEISKFATPIFWQFWKSWIWDQYLPESMESKFGDMEPISVENSKRFFGSLNFRNFETKKPRNSETKKPRNQETKKPRNQETKKPFLFSSKGIPSTPQHTDSHPCTLAAAPRKGAGARTRAGQYVVELIRGGGGIALIENPPAPACQGHQGCGIGFNCRFNN